MLFTHNHRPYNHLFYNYSFKKQFLTLKSICFPDYYLCISQLSDVPFFRLESMKTQKQDLRINVDLGRFPLSRQRRVLSSTYLSFLIVLLQIFRTFFYLTDAIIVFSEVYNDELDVQGSVFFRIELFELLNYYYSLNIIGISIFIHNQFFLMKYFISNTYT